MPLALDIDLSPVIYCSERHVIILVQLNPPGEGCKRSKGVDRPSNMLKHTTVWMTWIERPVAESFLHRLLSVQTNFNLLAVGNIVCDTHTVQAFQKTRDPAQFAAVWALARRFARNDVHADYLTLLRRTFDDESSRRAWLSLKDPSLATIAIWRNHWGFSTLQYGVWESRGPEV